MPANTNTPKRGAGVGSTSDIDTIIPLLFAANPTVAPNYKKMSAMDEHKRTASALEHKFRKWRQVGRDILAAHPEEAESDKAVGQPAQAKKPRTPTKQVNGSKQNDNDSEDNHQAKQSSSKKRTAAAQNGDESPTKKPKAQKKGTAQKAKKGSKGGKTELDESSGENSDNTVVKKENALNEDEGSTELGVEMEFEQKV